MGRGSELSGAVRASSVALAVDVVSSNRPDETEPAHPRSTGPRPRRGRSAPNCGSRFSPSSSAWSGWSEHARTLAAPRGSPPPHGEESRSGPGRRERPRPAGVIPRPGQAIKDERSITPAAEWLVDNFHIVDEQLREIRDDLPPDYYRELPKLAEGHLAGYPRVIGMAWAYIAHTDSRFDPESLRRMVRAYQEVEPLTIGELWAIAISLRILLVENLRRLAEQIVAQPRRAADGRRARRRPARPRRRQRRRSPRSGIAPPRRGTRAPDRVERPALPAPARPGSGGHPGAPLAGGAASQSQGTTAEEMVRLEHQRQATMNVTVRNVITSMRLISWFDWAEFVESVSLVDEVLRDAERVRRDGLRDARPLPQRRRGARARARAVTEVDVARRRPRWPRGRRRPSDVGRAAAARRRDPGYYLISDGRPALERGAACPRPARAPAAARLRRASATTGYLGTLAARHRAAPRRAARCCLGDRGVTARARRRSRLLALVPGVRPRGRPRQPDGHPDRSARGRCRGSSSTTACRRSCARSSSSRCC